jgi:IS30 family transposase
MHTNKNLTPRARSFRKTAKGQLADLGLSVTTLAVRIGKSRNAVSRAINRGEFPRVQDAIRKELAI